LGVDLSLSTHDLVAVKVRPNACYTDNWSDVLRGNEPLLLAACGADVWQPMSCGIHPSLLVVDDLVKRAAIDGGYLPWLKDEMCPCG
jgi:hypothetical protein